MLYAVKRWQNLPIDQRNAFALKAALWGGGIIVLALVISGRAHWLMGVLAALIALAGRTVQLAQYLPIFRKIFNDESTSNNGNGGSNSALKTSTMSRKDAAEILGVNEHASRDEIRAAHKKLMQKIHPDRGGTDALAAQINNAKKILLT